MLYFVQLNRLVVNRIIKVVLFVVLLLATVAAGIGFYFHRNIQPILITEINKALAVEVSVDKITLSGLRDFPNLGIKLSNVSIQESTSFYKNKLLIAKELNLFIDVWKLYKGEYVIDKILLRKGELRMADLREGTNYAIIKPTAEANSSTVSFAINDLILVDCQIEYQNVLTKFSCKTRTTKSIVALKYTEAATQLDVTGQLNSTSIRSGNEQYLTEKDLSIRTKVTLHTKEQTIAIAPSSLRIQDVDLTIQGTLDYTKRSAVDIVFSNASTSIKSLLSILPKNVETNLQTLNLTGTMAIEGHLTGKTFDKHEPQLSLHFLLQNAATSVQGLDQQIVGINASGDITIPAMSKLANASASFALASASNGTNALRGKVDVQNFVQPTISWEGEAQVNAAFIFGLLEDSNFSASDGTFNVDGKATITYDLNKNIPVQNSLRYSGTVTVTNLTGRLTDPSISIQNGQLDISVKADNMVVKSASIGYNNTTAHLSGYVENYTTLLNTESTAKLVGELTVNNLYINELYRTTQQPTEQGATAALIPLHISLNTEFVNFKFNDFVAEKMQGILESNQTSIRMPQCEITALGGKTIANIALKKWGDNHLLDINSAIENINISELFKQFNNFEQSEITSTHLSGTLTGNILAKVILDANFEPILPKLYAKATVRVENGALVNYEPLAELSSFAKIEDLKNVQFKSLENTIEIFDQTIFIPKMKIANNALNLEIEGTHTFDNYMSYNISLSVAELLATKANWIARKAEKRIERNKAGGLTAYILMEGTPEKLRISYDRATVKENVKEEVKNEKTRFIQALQNEGSLQQETEQSKNYGDVWDE